MPDEMKLYHIEKGTGIPLILLHGNGEDSSYFSDQISYFSRFYRVIAVDTRGHGRSPRGNKPFTLLQFAEDLKKFLDQKSIPSCCLLGFSDGGNIALIFTLKYPQYVDKLILNGANISPWGVKMRVQLPIALEYCAFCFASRFDKGIVHKKELLELMVKEPHIKAKWLERITAPVLVIAGNRDMIRRSHCQKIARHLKNGRLCIIKGGHFIAKESSAKFNRKVKEFMMILPPA